MSNRLPKAEDVMGSEGIISISENKTVQDSLRLMREKKKSKIVLVDANNENKKLLTMPDLLGVNPTESLSSLKNRLKDVARVDSNSDIEEIRKKIETNPLMIVTRGNRDIGVITISDMVKALNLM
jgi:predicted transcriptional regulator